MQVFKYKARNKDKKLITGFVESTDKLSSISELKQNGFTTIDIEEYVEEDVEKKDNFFSKFKEKTSQDTPYIAPKEPKKLSWFDKLLGKEEVEQVNLLKSKKFKNINDALMQEEVMSMSIDKPKLSMNRDVAHEINTIDVEAIINADFKDGNNTFEKIKTKTPNLFKQEIDLDTVKKILSSDIGGSKDGKKEKKQFGSKKVPPKDLMLFCKKMGTLLETGVNITKSFQLLIEQTDHHYFKKVLAVITRDISQGYSVSQSMAKFPKVFDEHFVALIKTGENTGELAKTFNLLYDEIFENQKLKGKVIGASIYPMVLVVVLLGAIIVAAKVIVPMFSDLFVDTGMPPFTEKVFAFFTFFGDNLHWIAVGIALLIMLYGQSKKFLVVRYRLDILKLKIPVLGGVMTEYYVINILRTLDIALKNGLAITDAITLAMQTTNNILFKFELQKINNQIIQGIPFSVALKNSPIMPSLLIQMISIGEESGKLELMIVKTLEYYEWSLSDFIDKSNKFIEPIAILLVAVFVCIFVFAVAVPMLDLSSGASMVE